MVPDQSPALAVPDPSAPPRSPSTAPAGDGRRRWVAIVTGALSVLVGVLYLLVIALLDSRGPLQPPPPEAFGAAPQPLTAAPLVMHREGGAAADDPAAAAPPRG